MTFNAWSLKNKAIDVTEFLKSHLCDICFITEAWLKVKDTSVSAEIRDLGYELILQPRRGKRGGGVCVIHKNGIDIKKCNVHTYKTFELLEVTIKGTQDLLRVSTLYRTGKMSTEGRSLFAAELEDYL